ncbi:MAG: helix-turn-helix domain-containing protein, partial [Bacteroidales bacterium]
IMFLGWLNAGTGIFEMIRAIMWELLIPVTLLSYFLVHLNHPFVSSKAYKLLYMPFLITLVIDVILELDFSMKWYKLPITVDNFIIQLFFEIENWLSLFFNAISMIWSRILIKRSTNDKKIKSWLLRLNFMLLAIIFIWFFQELGNLFLGSAFSSQIIWVSISVLLWFILYFGVFKLQIAIERKEIHQLIERQKKEKQHQEWVILNSKFNRTTQQSKLIARFMQLIEQDDWYKNPLLSRLDLATELGISEGYLSQKINQELGKSVIQIINEYRIAEAKRLLQDPAFNKYSIEAIGMEAGFKSKSVFYDLFKSSTGMSPGIFRK